MITCDRPFNFTYLNPFSFIRSADYSAGDGQSSLNNAIIGFDTEVSPLKRLAFQGTMLIDDLDIKTLLIIQEMENLLIQIDLLGKQE